MVTSEVGPRAYIAILLAFVVSFVVLWGVSFGAETACTNDFSCTNALCPDRCDWPEKVLWFAIPALAIAAAAGVLLVRRSGRAIVGVLPVAAVTLTAAVVMIRW